jgi:putative endonuclease
MNVQKIGLLGELRAAAYLKRQGMRILEKRWRAAHGEIDLIARVGAAIVFVEVKTRPRGPLDSGLCAVNAEKRRHLRSAALDYLRGREETDHRFDVIEITAAGLRHIKNAF